MPREWNCAVIRHDATDAFSEFIASLFSAEKCITPHVSHVMLWNVQSFSQQNWVVTNREYINRLKCARDRALLVEGNFGLKLYNVLQNNRIITSNYRCINSRIYRNQLFDISKLKYLYNHDIIIFTFIFEFVYTF